MSTTIPNYLTYETLSFTKKFYSQKLYDAKLNYNESCEKLRAIVDNYTGPISYNTFWVGKEGTERGRKFFKENIAKGKTRVINSPNKVLRRACKEMVKELNLWTQGLKWMTGFTVNCSVLHNAMEHKDCKHLVNIDLEDFFHQFDLKQIETISEHIFNWNKHTARKFARMVTHNGRLVQGNPLSPILTNIITTHVDIRINKWAKNFGWSYSRYADDITISSKNGKIKTSSIKFLINKIIEDEGLKINEKKVTVSTGDNIETTGLRTGNTVAPKKKVVKKKLNYFLYLKSLGVEYTNRLNKEGNLIKIDALIQGYKAWLSIINSRERITSLSSFNRTKWRWKIAKRAKINLKLEMVRLDFGNGQTALVNWNPIKDTAKIFRCKYVLCERYATDKCDKTCKYHKPEYLSERYKDTETKLKRNNL